MKATDVIEAELFHPDIVATQRGTSVLVGSKPCDEVRTMQPRVRGVPAHDAFSPWLPVQLGAASPVP